MRTKKIAECQGLEARRTAKKGLVVCYRDGEPRIVIYRHDWRYIKSATIRRMLETLCYSDGFYGSDLIEAGVGGEMPEEYYVVEDWIQYYQDKYGWAID